MRRCDINNSKENDNSTSDQELLFLLQSLIQDLPTLSLTNNTTNYGKTG